MKNSVFKFFCQAVLVVLPSLLFAQKSDSVKQASWFAEAQFAGGIGKYAAGFGYEPKNEKFNLGLLYGFVPGAGEEAIHSLTAKFRWIPINSQLRNKYRISPIMAGVLVNYAFGKQYFGFNPPNYDFDYYGFPTSFYTAIFIGSKAGRRLPGGKEIHLYYELVSFDRELISFATNRSALGVSDILNLGFGLQYHF